MNRTANMFAATSEDLPLFSGFELTQAAEMPNQFAHLHLRRDGTIPFAEDAVTDVNSVTEFLARYYKPDRYHGRDRETPGYSAGLLASHEADYQRHGFDIISRHDSVTGKVVAYFGPGIQPPTHPIE